MRSSRRLCGLALAAAALAVAGCGDTLIDSTKVEKFTGKNVIRAGIAVKSVSCPKDPKAKKGATFRCTVTGSDGTKGDAIVTETDAKGHVTVEAPFMDPNVVETQTAKQIKKQVGTTVSVKCPEIVVVKAGGTYQCEATDGANKRMVRITITDANGSFTFKLV